MRERIPWGGSCLKQASQAHTNCTWWKTGTALRMRSRTGTVDVTDPAAGAKTPSSSRRPPSQSTTDGLSGRKRKPVLLRPSRLLGLTGNQSEEEPVRHPITRRTWDGSTAEIVSFCDRHGARHRRHLLSQRRLSDVTARARNSDSWATPTPAGTQLRREAGPRDHGDRRASSLCPVSATTCLHGAYSSCV